MNDGIDPGARRAPPSLRGARIAPHQVDVLAALSGTLPAPAANENGACGNLRPAPLDELQTNIFAALIATLPAPVANENAGGRSLFRLEEGPTQ